MTWGKTSSRRKAHTMAGLAEIYGDPENRTEAQQRLIDRANELEALRRKRKEERHGRR